MSDTATLALPDPRFALPKTDQIPDLKLTDTCDQCGPGVSAYVAARKLSLTLLFCAHHYRDNELALLAAGWEIKDERHRLEAANAAFKGSE